MQFVQRLIECSNALVTTVTSFFPTALAVCFWAMAPGVQAAPNPGGSGTLRSSGLQDICLKGTEVVPEVCGQVQVNWKLWALMGEPIGDFVLGWKPGTIRIASAEGGGSQLHQVDSLPAPLSKAAQNMELYVEAVAFVEKPPASPNYNTVAITFNTGVASKPGETSMNVPGGYDWDKFLHGGMSSEGIALGAVGWCSEKGRRDLSAKDAKAIMLAGVKLQGLQLCPKSTVDVSPMENAIAKVCESALIEAGLGPSSHFCPKKEAQKPEPKKANAIDDAFARLEGRRPAETANTDKAKPFDSMSSKFEAAEAERKAREVDKARALAAQRDREAEAERQALRREAAQNFCTTAKDAQDSCAAKTCGSKPSATMCLRSVQDPYPPCKAGPGFSCLQIPHYSCVEQGPNPKLPEWESCSAGVDRSCAAAGKPIASVDACVAERLK
ncbi:hypothetical protein [Variovorax sp. 770b2]|uniref:hypothetical protein n=1 Tax=Variovorax sp. 770b2 TaxID=1566271 RepID=UPI0008EB5A84|nr:hypothetical protein [Variovorax sp. 770b2]SFQ34372.1 hypothetical protein SAMN03159339_6867 [Variovorax sp. 770b2]